MPSDAEVAAAGAKIEAVDLANPATLDALDEVRFTEAGEQAAREALTSATGDALWAAVWVYASSATDPEPLRPLADNGDPSIRVMVAAALVALGDAAGFAGLESTLSETGHLPGSHPPISIGDFAAFTLSRYVQAAGAPASAETEEDVAGAPERWAEWLGPHAGELVFDASSRTWSTP